MSEIKIDADKKTITRTTAQATMTWTFARTGSPRFLAAVVAEHGADAVAAVMAEGDYYPPMLDPYDRQAIRDRLTEVFVAQSYISTPSIRPALERLSYSATEADAQKL